MECAGTAGTVKPSVLIFRQVKAQFAAVDDCHGLVG